MAANGEMSSDEESLPGSPAPEAANGHEEASGGEEESAEKLNSALKNKSRVESAEPVAAKPELPPQPDPEGRYFRRVAQSVKSLSL